MEIMDSPPLLIFLMQARRNRGEAGAGGAAILAKVDL